MKVLLSGLMKILRCRPRIRTGTDVECDYEDDDTREKQKSPGNLKDQILCEKRARPAEYE